MKFIIGDKSIDRISGPVSMYLLSVFAPTNLPHLILFGDDHTNSKYQCKSCTCDNNMECCMRLYDTDFFKLLNDYTKDKCDVDMYIENMDSNYEDVEINEYNKYINDTKSTFDNEKTSGITKLALRFKGCFYKIIKKVHPTKYNKICQAPNLNWYNNDVRLINIKDPNENKILETLISKFWDDELFGGMFQFSRIPLTVETFDEFIDILSNNCRGMSKLIEIIDLMILFYDIDNSYRFYRKLFSETQTKSFIVEKIPIENRENWLRKIISLLDDVNNLFYERLDHTLTKEYPEEYKRIKNQINYSFLSFGYLFQIFKDYLELKQTDKNSEETIAKFNELSNYIKQIVSGINPKLFSQAFVSRKQQDHAKFQLADSFQFYSLISIRQAHIIYSSFFMDIINLYRILTTKSKICIVYNGDEHCQILKLLLMKYGYKSRVDIRPTEFESNMQERCIDLKKYVFSDSTVDICIDDMIK